MRAELTNIISYCAVPFLCRTDVNLSWYDTIIANDIMMVQNTASIYVIMTLCIIYVIILLWWRKLYTMLIELQEKLALWFIMQVFLEVQSFNSDKFQAPH